MITFRSFNMDIEDLPWCAWFREHGERATDVIEAHGDGYIGYGRTEADSITELCRNTETPLWNEESLHQRQK